MNRKDGTGTGGIVTISGGNVAATGGEFGAGIGGSTEARQRPQLRRLGRRGRIKNSERYEQDV